MSSTELRPLSIGELFDRSFALYRQHFLLFFGISAPPHLLTLALELVQVMGLQRWTISGHGGRAQPVPVPFGSSVTSLLFNLVALVLTLLVYALTQGGTVQAVSDLYLGRQATIGSSLRRAWSEIANLAGVVLLNGLMIFLATLLLIIPGIYVACRLLPCLPAALVEHRTPRDSLSRSWHLTQDYALRAFLLLLLYAALEFGMGMLFEAPIAFGIAASGFNVRLLTIWLALQQLASTVTVVLVSPLFLIGACVFYFDLRIRKEAFDLQFMLDANSERSARGGEIVPSIL